MAGARPLGLGQRSRKQLFNLSEVLKDLTNEDSSGSEFSAVSEDAGRSYSYIKYINKDKTEIIKDLDLDLIRYI